MGKYCPNGCFEKIIKTLKSEGYVDVEYPHIQFSLKLERFLTIPFKFKKIINGKKTKKTYEIDVKMGYCPFCGSRLEDE